MTLPEMAHALREAGWRVEEGGARDEWRETVRDLFDRLHSRVRPNVFDDATGGALARELVEMIEARHAAYFCGPGNHIARPAQP